MTEITPPALTLYQQATESSPNYSKELGQDEFLELMMAQLEHQDPMKPMDNGEFLGQMAQFSTVTGIEEMQQSIQELSNTYAASQTMQATSLVGRDVLIESPQISLQENTNAEGSFELDIASSDVQLAITDNAGTVIRTVNLGQFGSGRHGFTWDGLNEQGDRVPPGEYTATVTAFNNNAYDAVTVLNRRTIDSVEFGQGGATQLNTLLGESLTLTDIREIRQASTPAQ